MKTFTLGLVLISMLSQMGCATGAGYQRILDSWVGKSADHLIDKWGPPQATFKKPNGSMVYTYQNDGGTVYNYNQYSNQVMSYNKSCRTTFTISTDNVITDYDFYGNTCRAYE